MNNNNISKQILSLLDLFHIDSCVTLSQQLSPAFTFNFPLHSSVICLVVMCVLVYEEIANVYKLFIIIHIMPGSSCRYYSVVGFGPCIALGVGDPDAI